MGWLEHFEQNATDREEIPWDLGIHVEPYLRVPLIRSLQRFQVGEQGDGKHLIRAARSTGDPIYARTIELFIQEEQGHSRLLASLLVGMGASLLEWHWSDFVFVQVRRLCGLKLELIVLLSAEMIAKRYYRALYEGTGDPVLRAAFGRILRHELGHVAFHTEFLRHAFGDMPALVRQIARLGWRVFFGVACRVVAHDHRGVLNSTGVERGEFFRDCHRIFKETSSEIFDAKMAMAV